MAVNVYLPHSREKRQKQNLCRWKSKLSGAEDFESEVDGMVLNHTVYHYFLRNCLQLPFKLINLILSLLQ